MSHFFINLNINYYSAKIRAVDKYNTEWADILQLMQSSE